MWKVRGNDLQMDEGDFGIALPFIVKGTTLTASDCMRFVFMNGQSGETILEKSFTDIEDNTVNFVLTEAEGDLFPGGAYVYDLEWYQDDVFQCKLIQNGIFKVVA